MKTSNFFMGYKRPDGRVGVRNQIAVVPAVGCANGVVDEICREVEGVINLKHQHGCGRMPEKQMHTDALIGLGANPNFYGTLVVGLGCEVIPPTEIYEGIKKSGTRCELLVIQEDGGSRKTAKKGIEIVKTMIEEAKSVERTEEPLSKLIIGLECGGSDALSGVTANPSIGKASDWIVGRGGSSILTETTEMIGAEDVLKERCLTDEVRDKLLNRISETESQTFDLLGKGAGRIISPGNMEGGMSTIQEKSLGCVKKGGSTPIVEFLEYGQKPTKNGLLFMDGPGYDIESLAGLFATGAQIAFFSSGRGNPIGFPGMPVIKVSSNSNVYNKMKDDIDVNAGEIFEGKTLDDIGNIMINKVLSVIDGEETKSEINKQNGVVSLYSYSRSF